MMKDYFNAKMLYINPNSDDWKFVQIEDFVDILETLDCDLFDCRSVRIGDTLFMLYFDANEEQMEYEHMPVLFDEDNDPLAYGKIVMCELDNDGNDVSISLYGLLNIIRHAVRAYSANKEYGYRAIGGVEW